MSDIQVSVVIPAFNCVGTIRRAIDSVLGQTRPVEQIIVVDDGSTDGTSVVVSEYGGRIEYFWQPNAGPGAARNKGIQEATQSWIAFLDADDEWMPEKLECQIHILKTRSELMWITGNYTLHDSQGRSGPSYAMPLKSPPDRPSFFQAFVQGCWGCTDTMLIRRQVFDTVGNFRGDHKTTEDLDMWFRIAYRYPDIGICPEPLSIYHLDSPDSLIKSRSLDVQVMIDFFSRNLRLSEEHGKLAEFRPCATVLMRMWIRGLLFDGMGTQAWKLTHEFGYLLPWHYRLSTSFASLFPSATAGALRNLSRLLRASGLRRGPTRQPPSSSSSPKSSGC